MIFDPWIPNKKAKKQEVLNSRKNVSISIFLKEVVINSHFTIYVLHKHLLI